MRYAAAEKTRASVRSAPNPAGALQQTAKTVGVRLAELFRTAALAMVDELVAAKAALDEILKLVLHARAPEIEKTVLSYQPQDRKRAADGMRRAGLAE